MITIGDKKYERIFSLKTPTKQLIVVANKDDDESLVVVKNNHDTYSVIKSFYSSDSAKDYCKDMNEKLKIIHKAEKFKSEIPYELR